MDLGDVYTTVRDFFLGGKVNTKPIAYKPGVEAIGIKDTTPYKNKTGGYRTDILKMMLKEGKKQGLNREQTEGVIGRSMVESGMGEEDDINPLQVNEKVYGLSPDVRNNIQKGVELMKQAYGKYPENHFRASQSFHRPNRVKWTPFTREQALKSNAYRKMLKDNPQIKAFVDEEFK